MKKKLLPIVALLIPVAIAGCIASGTVVMVFDVDGFTSSNATIAHQNVNMSENSDYEDNKDKIKSVDAITLTGYIINHNDEDITAEAWMSDDSTFTTEDEVRNNGIQILETPTVPANDTLFLAWADGMAYLRNFDALENEIKNDGSFTVYGIASGSFDLEYRLNIVVTITAGL